MSSAIDVISSDPRTWSNSELGKTVHIDENTAGTADDDFASSWGVRGRLLKVTHEWSFDGVRTAVTLRLGSGDEITVLAAFNGHV